MKLYEVLSPKTLRKDAANYVPQAFSAASSKRTGKLGYLGSGAFAQVYSHTNRPGTAFKVGIGGEDNSYIKYVIGVTQNERWKSNPYLPRIYAQKIYSDKADGYSFVVEMEKLEPFQDASAEEVEAIIDKAFGDLPRMYAEDVDRHHDVTTMLSRVASGNPQAIRQVRDKKLLQALAMIGNIAKRATTAPGASGAEGRRNAWLLLDLHIGNVMIRRTSVGPQLVITDPLV